MNKDIIVYEQMMNIALGHFFDGMKNGQGMS